MKKKSIILTAIAFLLTLTLQAQEQQANEQSSNIKWNIGRIMASC